MHKKITFKIEYTAWARNLVFRFPHLSMVLTHINFWVTSYLFYILLTYSYHVAIQSLYGGFYEYNFLPSVMVAMLSGIFYGFCTGSIENLSQIMRINNMSIGLKIVTKGLLYFAAFVLMWYIFNKSFITIFTNQVYHIDLHEVPTKFRLTISLSLLSYTFILNILFNYIIQVNNKFGPGKLIPILLGKYQYPRVEERIFLFMDLKSSTQYAEKIGHLLYSELIKDCFHVANRLLSKHDAEIYQYVGDELVLTWSVKDKEAARLPFTYFLDYSKTLKMKGEEFEKKYGFVPEFKAGAHCGEVTAIEVGEVKREIAYHGDTINTAARIQEVCNKFKQSFIVSEALYSNLDNPGPIIIKELGSVQLKGKSKFVNLYAIDIDNSII